MMDNSIKHRVRNMIGRCILSVINDDTKLQSLQIEALDGEVHDGAERVQNYGFTSHPHADAEGVVIFPSGLRSHPIVIAVDDRRYRLTGLRQGEVALYDDLGQKVHLKRDGIEIETPMDVRITAANVNVTADSVAVDADSVIVNSDDINLGGEGGQKVARIGDDVNPQTMKIVTGSDKVKAT